MSRDLDCWRTVALRHALRRGGRSAPSIKGDAKSEPAPGLVPGYSASGQDVWLDEPLYSGPGLVVSAVGARCGKVFEARGDWSAVANTAVLIPQAGHDPHYLWYLTNDEDFWEKGGTAQPYVRVPETLARRVCLPPLEEQRAIADFLDTETARIDTLIAKKRRMIDLLDERFDCHVRQRLADAGPVLPLKRRWRVVDCKHRTPEYIDDGYPVVSPGDVSPGRLDLARAHRFVGEADFRDLADPIRKPRRGDIIYSRNASIGVAAYVDTDAPFCMGQDVCLVTSANQDQLYLAYVLNSVGVDQLDAQKIGSTFSRVNVAQIVDLEIPSPPPAIQHRLAQEFDEKRRRHDRTVTRLRQQIALLQEHRQALITAAVTGELDVPGAA